MPEPNGRDIFNEPNEVKCVGLIRFHDSRYVSSTLADPKNFGIKPPDFGTKCGASVTEELTPTEFSSLFHGADSTHVRPEAATLFYVTALAKESRLNLSLPSHFSPGWLFRNCIIRERLWIHD